jgi:hypothetical protein
MPESNDLAKSRAGLDVARPLCPADSLRIDLVSTLRLVIDAAGESVLEGRGADVTRLVSAVEQLTRLLPKAATEAPEHHREDPRAALLALILQQRAREGIGAEGVDARDDEIARLQAENAQLRSVAMAAGLAVAHASCGTPPEPDIVPPSERADRDPGMRPGPDDGKPPTVIDGDAVDIRNGFDNVDEPWRQHMNRNYDRWADNRD